MLKISIFGVGLIGGSLALCFKGIPDTYVVGYSNNPKSAEKYVQKGVVDFATTSIQEAVKDADLIFLCVPVGLLEQYLQEIYASELKPGCIITDVGSVKSSLMSYSLQFDRDDVHFIGGHPMAGKEKSGVEAASSFLFENALYVLTPHEHTPDAIYQKLADLLQYTKAHVIRMDAITHDRVVGAISHLPHVIAVALVNQISKYNESNDLYQLLAAGGFRDITRIASSDPIVWRDILLSNREFVLELLRDWNHQIEHFINLLEVSDGTGIQEQFQQASAFRTQMPERRKGVMSAMYDVYVNIPDHPGVIGRIASSLGDERINLSNIQIMENRLDIPGVLKLSFRDVEDLERAILLLKKMNFSVQL